MKEVVYYNMIYVELGCFRSLREIVEKTRVTAAIMVE